MRIGLIGYVWPKAAWEASATASARMAVASFIIFLVSFWKGRMRLERRQRVWRIAVLRRKARQDPALRPCARSGNILPACVRVRSTYNRRIHDAASETGRHGTRCEGQGGRRHRRGADGGTAPDRREHHGL